MVDPRCKRNHSDPTVHIPLSQSIESPQAMWRVPGSRSSSDLASQHAPTTSVDISTAFPLGERSETPGRTDDGSADGHRGLTEEPHGPEAGGNVGRPVSTDWGAPLCLAHTDNPGASVCVSRAPSVAVWDHSLEHAPLWGHLQQIITEPQFPNLFSGKKSSLTSRSCKDEFR